MTLKPWNIMSSALREYSEADGPTRRVALVTQLLSGRDTREMVPWHLKSLLDEALALRAAAVREIEKGRADWSLTLEDRAKLHDPLTFARAIRGQPFDEKDAAEEVPRKCRGSAKKVPLRYRAPADDCGCEGCACRGRE